MNEDKIERVRVMIAEHLGVSVDQVKDDAHFEQDLNADSLETLQILQMVEAESGVQIPDSDADTLHSIGDFKRYLAPRSENGTE